MQYSLLKHEVMTSPAFRGAEPIDRATWVCLLAYCDDQENGGRIIGCRTWGDRRWQQTIAVTKREVDRVADGLWYWDGDDLVVPHYDPDYVASVQVSRKQGAAGGRVSSEAKAAAARENGRKGGPKTTKHQPNTNPTPTQQNTQNEPNEPKPGCLAVRLAGINPPSPSDLACDPPTTATTPGVDLSPRAPDIDRMHLIRAIERKDVPGLLAEFMIDTGHDDEWARETAGKTLGSIFAVMAWRWALGKRIRKPSGFRAACALWGELTAGDRKEIGERMCGEYGIERVSA